MTGVASSLWLQPTGGEAGGEIRNCLTGWGGAKYDLSMSSSPFWTYGEETTADECCSEEKMSSQAIFY